MKAYIFRQLCSIYSIKHISSIIFALKINFWESKRSSKGLECKSVVFTHLQKSRSKVYDRLLSWTQLIFQIFFLGLSWHHGPKILLFAWHFVIVICFASHEPPIRPQLEDLVAQMRVRVFILNVGQLPHSAPVSPGMYSSKNARRSAACLSRK